ncbi:hypothetical protein TNCV_403491 [Trichonephila clavipes]|nr:hypothetical protein TNCV_403491 [Trichonephila clavipes]
MENNICNSMILTKGRRHFYLVGQSKHKVGACGVNNQASAVLQEFSLPCNKSTDGKKRTSELSKIEAELIVEANRLQLMKQDLEKAENAYLKQFHFEEVEDVTWCYGCSSWRSRWQE